MKSDQFVMAVDIETMRDDSAIGNLPEPKVDSRLKDPLKIAAATQEARAEQIEKMALDPMTGKICSIAIVSKTNKTVICSLDEHELVEAFFAATARTGVSNPEICSWNGLGFDLPYIYRRAIIIGHPLGAAPKLSYWMKRYTTTPHCDLMQVWGNWDSRNFAKLDHVAGGLLGENKVEIDVLTFPDLMKTEAGRKQIAEYNEKDAVLTLSLYDLMHTCLF